MPSWTQEIVIGSSTLYLGDCREIYGSLCEVDSIVTDPPYGMEFRSNKRSIKHRSIANDESEDALYWVCGLKAAHSKYIWMRWDNLIGLPKRPKSLVTWVKPNHSMGDLSGEHGRQIEVCAFFPGEGHEFPSGRPTDVIKSPTTKNKYHPTEKPVGLMLAVVSWTRGIVVDPFMGSGTTGVACARIGRPFIGIEIDPEHFETAVRRIEEATKAPDMFSVGHNAVA